MIQATQRYIVFIALLSVLGCNASDSTAQPAAAGTSVASENEEKATASSGEALSVVNDAIAATGGESKFDTASCGRVTMEIEGDFEQGMSGSFVTIDTFQLPGKLKRVVTGKSHEQEVDLNYVFNGDKGWMQMNGGEPFAVPIANPITQTFPLDSLNALLSLKSGDVELSVGDENEYNSQPVVCVEIVIDGEVAGSNYFHTESEFVVGSSKSFFDPSIGKTTSIDVHYSDYKDFNGLKIPTTIKTIMNGETTASIKVTEVSFMKTVDDAVFEKPVPKI